jgi:uncharacterized membrane protein
MPLLSREPVLVGQPDRLGLNREVISRDLFLTVTLLMAEMTRKLVLILAVFLILLIFLPSFSGVLPLLAAVGLHGNLVMAFP